LPESGLGQAIKYMSNRWTGLTRFLTDPRVPLDNGATERAMRGLAVGHKNHYGSRSRRGTEVAALYYSLMETAKLCGVDPKRYLREAALAALRGDSIPLPNQLEQSAEG
jgi:transposase